MPVLSQAVATTVCVLPGPRSTEWVPVLGTATPHGRQGSDFQRACDLPSMCSYREARNPNFTQVCLTPNPIFS